MVRAHRELPKPKEPKDLTPLFDVSDEAPVEMPKRDPKKAPPVPIEAMRGRKAKAKKGPQTKTIPVAEADVLEETHMVSDADVLEAKDDEPYEEMKVEGGELVTPRMEAQELEAAFEKAKSDFEQVSDAIDQRTKAVHAWAAEEAEAKGVDVMELIDQVLTREGLQESLDESMDKMIAARKAYLEARERADKEDAADAKDLAELVVTFRKQVPPTPVKEELMPRMSREAEEEERLRAAYNLAHPAMSEEEAAEAGKARAANEDREAKAHEAKLKAGAKPMDRFEEARWYGEGEKAAREAEQIAKVRGEIAGNPLEAPIGTPADLSALGFDQVFIKTYQDMQASLEKAEAAKGKAGFFKKLFGGAKLEREYEAARSDFESMQEEVTQRRTAAARALQESAMTPAQREAKRRSDEVKMKGVISRGH